MTLKSTKMRAKLLPMVYLIDENEVKTEMGEAFASFMLNPAVTWTKFVLTDDRKNANGQRVPREEFANILRSGVHMPVKMALGEISPGHSGTEPLGTITHLKEIVMENGIAAIVAIAALWSQERPSDIELIKQRFAEKSPVDISWEILYENSEFNEEFASEDLIGTALRAATIVGDPAYQGRTPFLAISAKNKDASEDLDKNAEDELKTIEELQAEVDRLTAALAEATSKSETASAGLTEKDTEIARLTKENTEKETELASLREYKQTAEAEVQKKEKLESIRTKFVEAGITKDDEYFTENEERLLKMDEDLLTFHIQEVAAGISEDSKTSTASKEKKTKIPNVTSENEEEVDLADPRAIGRYMRERGKKK